MKKLMHIKVYVSLLVLMLILIFNIKLKADTYYTLTDGAWEGTIWSTDGVTNCFCEPPTTTGNNKIIIRDHVKVYYSDVKVEDTLILDSNAILDNSNHDLIVESTGRLYTRKGSDVRMKKLRVKPEAEVIMSGTSTALDDWEIEGTITLNAKATLENEKVVVKSGGVLNINPNGYLLIKEKELKVESDGTINLNNAFINVEKDLVENKGTITGTGGISAFEEVKNDGSWSSGVNWCSDGSSSGMSSPEDCGFRSGMLPIVLAKFYGTRNGNSIDLFWLTALEVDNDYFTVERSTDAVNFEPIGIVIGQGNNIGEFEYRFTDYNPPNGTCYYRLRQTDFDGKEEIHKVIAVDISDAKEANEVQIRLDCNNGILVVKGNDRLMRGQLYITVNNLMGETILLESYPFEPDRNKITIEWPHNLPRGVYFIQVEQQEERYRKIEKIYCQ